MLRSLYASISGLRAHQTMMDVTANNIANVNTQGFKAGRALFADALSNAQPDTFYDRLETRPPAEREAALLAAIDALRPGLNEIYLHPATRRGLTPTMASSRAPTRSAAASSPTSTRCWSMRSTAARPSSTSKRR